MFILQNLLRRLKPLSAEERQAEAIRRENAARILISELREIGIDGKPLVYRRLESLMMSAGTSKRETISLLREIGATPSSNHGCKIWSLKPRRKKDPSRETGSASTTGTGSAAMEAPKKDTEPV